MWAIDFITSLTSLQYTYLQERVYFTPDLSSESYILRHRCWATGSLPVFGTLFWIYVRISGTLPAAPVLQKPHRL